MNERRRKELNKAKLLIEEALEIIDACAVEEQEYYDCMPENLQSSDRGIQTEGNTERLNEINEELRTFIEYIDICAEKV